MPNNELTHPSGPINGRTLVNLKAVLESFLGGGEVRDLDLALLMNVPLNRLSQLKRAKSSIYTVGRTSDKSVGLDAEEEEEESAELPGVRPSQAILVRLLLKRPDLVPIPLRPTSAEVFDLLQPFMGVVDQVKYIKSGGKSGFAPLFGRSYISSYKMLGEGAAGMQNAGLPVARLQMLVVGKYSQFFRDGLRKYAVQSRSAPAFVKETLQCKAGWGLLREKDSLTDWMDDALHDRFESEVYALFSQWFSNCYLGILKNEAKSRDLDPVAAIIKGKWVNSSAVSDDKLRQYDRFSRPILGSSDSLFSLFRESFGLTSAEAYWVLGLQVKAFYRFRQQPDRRVDAPTSILLRYLFQYPEDIGLFMPKPMPGAEIFDKIKDEDGNFKLGQLAPLFGASRVMSYEFSNPDSPCPFFARRLAMVFQAAFSGGEPIYRLLRECVEEEVQARGLSSDLFWRDGRWHK
jgi:hypothetical protein